MAVVQFYPLDVGVRLVNRKPAVTLYGRTVSGEHIAVVDDSYLPYFYVVPRSDPAELEQDLMSIRVKVEDDIYSISKIEKKTMKLNEKDTQVLKIYVSNPFSFALFYDEIMKNPSVKAVYEHDVPFMTSYLVDRRITPCILTDIDGEFIAPHANIPVIKAESMLQEEDESIKNPRILSFDIETYSPKGRATNTDTDPILMISFYSETYKKTITWKRFTTNDESIEFVEDEFALLNRFKKVIEEFKPDFLVGFASDIYTFPYLKKRAGKYSLRFDLGLDKSFAEIGKDETYLKGIVHIDIYKFISKIYGSKLQTENFTLEEVAMELLGEGKKPVDMTALADIWDSSPEQLHPYCDYNLNDAILSYKLFVKQLPYILEFVKLTNMQPFDAARASFVQCVDYFMIKESKVSNELILNKPSRDLYEKRHVHLRQANVLEPEQGIYNNIAVYDFKSLYPSIVATHNISLGTIGCRCCDEPVPNEEIHFCKRTQGFISKLVSNIIDRRQRILKLLADESEKSSEQMIVMSARQETLKMLADLISGNFGFPSSRWYDFECANAISAYGRFYLDFVTDKAKTEGFEVLHADTDSIFIKLGHKKLEDVQKFFENLNASLPEKMNLDYEGFYPRGIFISSKTGKATKKYALLSENGFLKIKGLESARRNFSTIAKETQEQVLYYVLKEKKLRKAMQHVQEVIENVKNHKIPVRKMMIFTQLARDVSSYETIAPHVAVAQRMQNQGFNVGPGSIIRYVVAQGEGSIAEMSRPPNEVTDYNADYYVENQIIPAVEKIFEAAGVDFSKALEEKEQISLSEFI